MSGWDLKPQGISQVLKSTGESASHLEKYAKAYGEHLTSAATHAGDDLGGRRLGRFGWLGWEGAGGSGGACVVAVCGACVEGSAVDRGAGGGSRCRVWWMRRRRICTGDEEMALEAQRKTLSAPKLDMPGGKGKAGRA